MATLSSVYTVSLDGEELFPLFSSAASGGDQFLNDGYQRVFFGTSGAQPEPTITFVSQMTVGDLAVADKQVTLGAGSYLGPFGPFPTHIWNDASGYVQMTYSSATGLQVLVYTEVPFE